MFFGLALFPEQASTFAPEVDSLFFYLLGVSVFFTVLIYALVLFFAIKYKRKSDDDQPKAIHGNNLLEIIWTIIPFCIVMTFFIWGASLFYRMNTPPDDALEIFVVGKQWMWKLQHPEGMREINDLHIPVGQPIRLTMTSEDVIHSFYVPAFRIKMDVVPGKYTTAWFEATKPGKYHLFCAEYCGTSHSEMIGTIYAMPPHEYQEWLDERSPGATKMSSGGEALFTNMRCHTCHNANSGALGPNLEGIYGSEIKLSNGKTVKADEAYIRESILKPKAKIVQGYSPLMPSYKAQLSEEEILEIINYLRGLEASSPTHPREGGDLLKDNKQSDNSHE